MFAGRLPGLSLRAAYRAASVRHIPLIRLGRRILGPTVRLHAMQGTRSPLSVTRCETIQESTGCQDVEVR